MEIAIEYQKAVDTLDEGILALNLYKSQNVFPEELRNEIISIMKFLKLADKPEYENLLYDKRISINKERLTNIHKNIKNIKFSIEEIDIAIELLNKTKALDGLKDKDLIKLEKYLLEFSHPLWVSSITRDQNGK